MRSEVVEMRPLLDNTDNDRNQEEQSGSMIMTPSIYKVPPLISNNKKEAYQPRVVSFGPYHHGESHLAPMEAHKRRACYRYIDRLRRSMKDLIDSVTPVARELKGSYDSLDSKWQLDTEGFVQLMILDGCFMLELLEFYKLENYDSNDNNDPVFSEHGDIYVTPFIRDDMILLENQLPILLLVKLKNIHDETNTEIDALNKDILSFLFFNNEEYQGMGRCLHVLDLFRKALLSTHNQPRGEAPESTNQGEGRAKSKSGVGHDVVRKATELHEAGIRFKKSEGNGLLAITFDDVNGELKLPNFVVNDHTESRFLNLIAFERCRIPAISDITSFIAFMNCIIDDGRDIKLLSSKGIINNILGTDKEAADLFNTMSKDLVLWNDPLFDVYQKLVDYSKKTWPKHRANLFQTYFTNPWAIISVGAAFILFSLTLLQTVFTIRN